MLLVRHFPRNESMFLRQRAEQKLGRTAALLAAGQVVVAALAEQFRDESVGVRRAKVGVSGLQRVNFLVVIEETCRLKKASVTGDLVQLVHRIVKTAKLVAQHTAAHIVAEGVRLAVSPLAHALRHGQRSVVVAQRVLVDESLKYLVQRVPRRPNALPLYVAVNQSLPERREITSAVGALHLVKSGHDAVGLGLDGRASGLRVEIGESRHDMPRDVASQVAVERLPAAELFNRVVSALKPRKHTGRIAETVQQTLRRYGHHPRRVALEIVMKT